MRRGVAVAVAAALVAVLVAALPPAGGAAAAALAVVLVALVVVRGVREARPAAAVDVPSARREELLAFLDLVSEGMLLLDERGLVIAANEAAARILDRPRDGMAGVSLIRAARDHALVEVLREASGVPREVLLPDQRILFATAARVDAGEVRTVLTLQDLTPLRRAERARQELVANVSHELRTPIAAAQALAETLESGVDDEAERARFLGQLTGEIERLGRIVDRLLRLSRLETRVEEFVLEDIGALELLEEARIRIGPVAERKGISLTVEADATLRVRADRERILEVFANLLDNAIRHAPPGSPVALEARVDQERVRFSVRDRGPGIMPQERSRIFERFYTGDRARSEVGTGLGLAIARHIVSRHGGAIWVADETPGAAICFSLPFAS